MSNNYHEIHTNTSKEICKDKVYANKKLKNTTKNLMIDASKYKTKNVTLYIATNLTLIFYFQNQKINSINQIVLILNNVLKWHCNKQNNIYLQEYVALNATSKTMYQFLLLLKLTMYNINCF
jgi:hypothetical protein